MSLLIRRRVILESLLLLAGGCGLAQDVIPGGDPPPFPDVVTLQENLLRLADGFQAGTTLAMDKLRREQEPLDPKTLLQWKIAVVTATHAIATGADPRSNLLDLTAFATLMRMYLEDHWKPRVFGDSALPLLEVCRSSEEELWKQTAKLLSPEQMIEFRVALDAWKEGHPLPEGVMAARSIGFALELAASDPKSSSRKGSVFNLLSLDPLSSLDPAVRELAQARLLGERALYVTQRLPKFLRWQAELITMNVLELPAVEQLSKSTAQVSASVERITAVAEKLPDRISREREQLVKALETQEKNLKPLVTEVRQTLEAGNQLSQSLTATLKALEETMKRLEPPPGAPPKPPSEPFRIQDYTAAAAQMDATVKNMTGLVESVNRMIGSPDLAHLGRQVGPAVQTAEAAGKAVVDYAFLRGLLLVLAVLVAAVLYRVAAIALQRRSVRDAK